MAGLHRTSSRAVLDLGTIPDIFMVLFVALALLTKSSVALDLSVALQRGQAFSSTRCVMNEFSSSISTVIQRFYSRSNVHSILFSRVRRQKNRRPERTSRSTCLVRRRQIYNTNAMWHRSLSIVLQSNYIYLFNYIPFYSLM